MHASTATLLACLVACSIRLLVFTQLSALPSARVPEGHLHAEADRQTLRSLLLSEPLATRLRTD